MSSPSGLKMKPWKQRQYVFQVSLYSLENRNSTFFRNVDIYLWVYTAPNPREIIITPTATKTTSLKIYWFDKRDVSIRQMDAWRQRAPKLHTYRKSLCPVRRSNFGQLSTYTPKSSHCNQLYYIGEGSQVMLQKSSAGKRVEATVMN